MICNAIDPTTGQRCHRSHDHLHCQVCGQGYRYDDREDRPPSVICGRIHCRARHTWGPDDWAGKARMALARLSAHGEGALNDLDREALRRAGLSAAAQTPGAS